MIARDILIEDLISERPQSVRYLMQKGIRCIVCGDPIWGSLESAAREKGFSDEQIDQFVAELSRLPDSSS